MVCYVLCTVNTMILSPLFVLTFNILPMLHSQVMSLNWRQSLVRAVTVIIIGISIQLSPVARCLKPSLRPRLLKVTSSALHTKTRRTRRH